MLLLLLLPELNIASAISATARYSTTSLPYLLPVVALPPPAAVDDEDAPAWPPRLPPELEPDPEPRLNSIESHVPSGATDDDEDGGSVG
ncbi:hypothetical protein V6N13_104700 [Hibiscus sabdariffa]